MITWQVALRESICAIGCSGVDCSLPHSRESGQRKQVRPVALKSAVRAAPAPGLRALQELGELLQRHPQAENVLRFGKSAAILLASFGAVSVWLVFGPFAIYPPVGFIDPWFYTGYFTNFSYLLLHRGFSYYVSRLPWIIPGRTAFGIASPELASLLLCAGIVTVSGFSVYCMVRWYYGRAPAVLAALALITNPYFMFAAGWQYPDGAAIAYATVALALYLRPHSNWGWNDLLASSALTLSASTNLAGAPMLAALLVIPLLRWRHSRRQLIQRSLCTLAGIAITTLLLMEVSKSVLGDLRIYKPQFDMWLHALRNPDYLSNTWGSGSGFLTTATRLFTPAFLLLFGPVLLLASRKPAAPAWPVYFALLTCCSLYAFQEFALDRAGLRVPYVSSYMMVLVSCFTGIVLGELWMHKQAGGTAVAAWLLTIFIMALPFVYNVVRPLALPSRVWSILSCLGIGAIVFAILSRGPRPFLRYATCALVLIAISAGPATDNLVNSGLGEQKIVHGSNLSQSPRAASFQCLMNLQEYLKSQVDDPRWDLIFWWDQDEPLSDLFRSAESMYVSQHRDVTKMLSGESGRIYLVHTMMVHFTTRPERLAERKRLMASRGIGVAYERQTELSYGEKRFTVALQDLTAINALP
jgi:hypothetical protein